MNHDDIESPQRILSVSELTRHIKTILEDRFPFVWITGEISNLRRPSSGHCYFTLKDDAAQISAVVFKGQIRNLKFDLDNGMAVMGFGRVSVYEPRGSYQIILEYVEPGGTGALQLAFEQRKARLAAEGLFDEAHKQPLPFLPRKIGVVSSPTGAVIHDILSVLHRRFDNLPVQLVPVKVQGDGASEEIVAALDLFSARKEVDVVILARGGGSLEDLQPFNEEPVARAVFRSKIPVVSAVGHETDYTIADFTADLRAPTPSAAAELVVPRKMDLLRAIGEKRSGLATGFTRLLDRKSSRLQEMTEKLKDPRRQIDDFRMKTDAETQRLMRRMQWAVQRKRERLHFLKSHLLRNNPINYISITNNKLEYINHNLLNNLFLIIKNRRSALKEQTGRLEALDPRAVLRRGYSITRTVPEQRVVRDPDQLIDEQPLEIILEKGIVTARVDPSVKHGSSG